MQLTKEANEKEFGNTHKKHSFSILYVYDHIDKEISIDERKNTGTHTMGNNQTKHTILRYGIRRPLGKKYSDTPSFGGVSKSATTGFLHERSLHLPDDLYIESENNSTSQYDANFKRYSCFNFSACQPVSRTDSLDKCEHNQHDDLEDTIKPVDGDCLDTSKSSNPVKLRNSTSHRTLLKSTSGLFTKVCQRLVHFNRRSHPVNLTGTTLTHGSTTFDEAKLSNPFPRSVTDSNVVHNSTGLNRKFGLGKSPAIQDLHGVNENPEMATKMISDLLEENEASYDEYENDMTYDEEDHNKNYYENNWSQVQQLQSDAENFRFQRRQFNHRPAQGSLGDSSSSYSEHSTSCDRFGNRRETTTACPFYELVTSVNNHNNNNQSLATTSKNLETTSFDFIDEGRSDYIESIASSRSPSIHSLQYSSYRGSLNNMNQLLCTDLACEKQLNTERRYSSSSSSYNEENAFEPFMSQVNKRLMSMNNGRQKKTRLPMYTKKYSKISERIGHLSHEVQTSHSQSLANNESALDIGHIYQEQYNDNISIFHNRLDRPRAPLASSETTTLSSSIDNLIDGCNLLPGNNNAQYNYKLFNPIKYPLINRLILSHQQQMDANNNNINDNVDF